MDNVQRRICCLAIQPYLKYNNGNASCRYMADAMRVYRILSVAEAGNQKESKECIRDSLLCNGTHKRSGCSPAEPYPPVSIVIVLPCAEKKDRLLRFENTGNLRYA